MRNISYRNKALYTDLNTPQIKKSENVKSFLNRYEKVIQQLQNARHRIRLDIQNAAKYDPTSKHVLLAIIKRLKWSVEERSARLGWSGTKPLKKV